MKNISILLFLLFLLQANAQKLKDFDYERGVNLDSFSVSQDKFRFSIYGASSYNMDISGQLELELQLHKKLDAFDSGWAVFQLKKVSASYEQIASETSSQSSHPNSEALTPKGKSNQDILVIGGGYSHRFSMLGDLTKSKRVFEMFSFLINYVSSSDELTGQSYSGYGITSEFGLHKRASKRFFYGGKLSYNVASVIRSPISDEPKEDRSLSYTWTSLGLEIGYFF